MTELPFLSDFLLPCLPLFLCSPRRERNSPTSVKTRINGKKATEHTQWRKQDKKNTHRKTFPFNPTERSLSGSRRMKCEQNVTFGGFRLAGYQREWARTGKKKSAKCIDKKRTSLRAGRSKQISHCLGSASGITRCSFRLELPAMTECSYEDGPLPAGTLAQVDWSKA